jgi:hypothetical protein
MTSSEKVDLLQNPRDRLARVQPPSMIEILSKKIHSCAAVVPEFLAHPAPQSHLVGLRKVMKHPHVRYTAAVILNSIISTENIVDAVIDAVAMQCTSTHRPITSIRFRATKTSVLLLHFDQILLIASKKDKRNYSIFWANLLTNLMSPAAR